MFSSKLITFFRFRFPLLYGYTFSDFFSFVVIPFPVSSPLWLYLFRFPLLCAYTFSGFLSSLLFKIHSDIVCSCTALQYSFRSFVHCGENSIISFLPTVPTRTHYAVGMVSIQFFLRIPIFSNHILYRYISNVQKQFPLTQTFKYLLILCSAPLLIFRIFIIFKVIFFSYF